MNNNGPILVVSWFAPPVVSGSAVIVGNLAKQFGPDAMVVAGAAAAGCPPLAWQDDWAQRVEVGSEWPTERRGTRLWRRLQVPYFALRTARLARKVRARAVVVVFPSGASLLAGTFAAWAAQSQLFPYMHNCYVENRQGFMATLARAVQGVAFRRAAHVFVMSQGMLDLYRERYPDLSCSSLVHSFDEPLPSAPSTPPPVHDPLRLVLCGNINESCNDAARRLGQAIASTPRVHLTLLSGTNPEHLRNVGLLRDGVELLKVGRDQVMQHLHAADVVLLPHGFSGGYSEFEYRTIFPTKTIEYLLCGRPILAHSPPQAYLTQFLQEHRCAAVVDTPDVQSVVACLEQLRRDAALRARLVTQAQQVVGMFHGPRVAAHLREQIDGDSTGSAAA